MKRGTLLYLHGKQVTFYCNKGYRRSKGILISCNDGKWDNFQMPRCIRLCNDPGYIRNGRTIGHNFLDGKTVWFRCNNNYDLFGSSSIRCSKGSWSANKPTCKRRCSNPGRLRNGKKVGTDYKHNSTVVYSCNRNFLLQGSKNLRCNSGRWEGRFLRCQDCVGVGADVLGLWHKMPRVHIYFKASITSMGRRGRTLMKTPYGGYSRTKFFSKHGYDPLSIIMDRVPDHRELTKGTRVVAVFRISNPRLFTGKITNINSSKYRILLDDGDSAQMDITNIRLLVAPTKPFC